MANANKAVLVDGSAMLFRAYFAIPANLATTRGLHTNAIFGFATMFRKLFGGRKPDFGAVIFDSPVKTFREERYPLYKAQRPELPADLAEQLPWIAKLVDAHGFPRLRIDGYEADDVIGTLTRQAVAAGMEVVIVSSDKDFAQLIGDGVRMQDTLRDIVYDPVLVQKKWGVKPSQMVDFLALMGDESDNIPGVAGIGQKGASTLIATFGSLDGIYAHLDALKGKQRTALETHRDAAYLSKELATIDCAVPLPMKIEEMKIPVPDPAVLNGIYKELQFNSLLSQEARGTEGAPPPVEVVIGGDLETARSAMQAVLATNPVTVFPVFDLPTPIRGRLVGLALASSAGKGVYLPFSGTGKALGDSGLALMKPWLEDPSKPKIAHNVKELWQLLKRSGVALSGVIGDTMVASFLAEPSKLVPHRLDQVAREYLQVALPVVKSLTGGGQKERALHDVPVEDAAAFACAQADAICRLWPLLATRMDELEQRKLYETLELPLTYVLGQMELDGVRVDPADLKKIGEEFAARLAEYQKQIHELAGHPFNIGSTKQLGTVLFDELKLPVIKRTKTGYSTDSDVLERLAPRHGLPKLILEYRALDKLINTYTDVLQRERDPKTGRVHATFQQTAGVSGRLISTEPDLQRTPIKTPEGKRIRGAFIPDPGCMLISADWSQIELRVLAHVSKDPLLVDSFKNGVDVHKRTAGKIFHCDPKDVTPAQRNVGKTINFATIYGQGATALGQILGIPRPEAQTYIDEYFAAYAGVRTWLDTTMAEAHESGYVTTLLGRRRWIPELFSKRQQDEQMGMRIAANTPIQGSAADLCKLAMLQIARGLQERHLKTRMLMQIHDELVFEAPEGEVEKAKALVKEIMEHCLPLEVPLVTEIGVGKSWAEAH